jgi:hypothetical protein
MEAIVIYLVKASGLIALFSLAYYALLCNVTFFTSNRFFLLSGLFTAALLPFLVYTKTVWVTPEPIVAIQQVDINSLTSAKDIYLNTPQPEFIFDWYYVAIGVYIVGLIFFACSFLVNLYNVFKILRNKTVINEDGFKLIDSSTIKSPFSFFNYIVYNSEALSSEDLNAIICHEKVHSRQMHSVDIVFAQLACIAFWFNPMIWLYKKAISQNLEFIADAEATKQVTDKKAYQKTLLKITVRAEHIAITNHFYQSLIKKRIVMLNKKHSKKRNAVLYALVLPVLIAFVVLFQVEVIAQEKTSAKITEIVKNPGDGITRIVLDVNKDAKDNELTNDALIFKQEFKADVTFSNVRRNSKGEITAIKVMVKDKDNQKAYPVYEANNDGNNNPIEPFTIDIERDSTTGKNVVRFNKKSSSNAKFTAIATKTDGAIEGRSYNNDSVSTTKVTVNHFKTNQKDGLIIINGIKQKRGSTIEIPFGDEIDNIVVVKDKAILESYGADAKDGVLLVTTKKKTVSSSEDESNPNKTPTNEEKQNNKPYTVTRSYTYKSSGQEDLVNNLIENHSIDYKKAYILINGKEATPEELAKLNPKKIETIVQLQATPQTITKFGARANNGAIIIETKSYKRPINFKVDNNTRFEANDSGNTGFLIHRKSQKHDLKFYTKTLKDMGIKLTYSDLKRNEQGEITSIKVELVDSKTSAKSSSSFSTTNGKGIPDVYVGRKNGELAVYGQPNN